MRRILLGSLATFALVSSGLASPAISSAAVDRSSSPGLARTATSSARAIDGTNIRHDPESLTAREAAALQVKQQHILSQSGLKMDARPNGSVTIPIDFHGVTNHKGDGFVSKARIHRQIRVLNRAYAGMTSAQAANTPFRFRLNSISRTKNDRWYNASGFTKKGNIRLRHMQRALHVGNARHLNMYTVGPKFELLGYAYLPATSPLKLDGVVLWGASLPGGNANLGAGLVYNQGDTATHEVGHWLNLLHTFQGSCGGLNDYVTDTPRQKAGDNIFEDAVANTCGTANGPVDPGHNFMNYADDPYLNQFTRGQRDRMNFGWYIRMALALS
jgi:hypothetical protein